jgi:hypothetical protein
MVRYREIPPPPQRVVPNRHPELILNWSQPFEYSGDSISSPRR